MPAQDFVQSLAGSMPPSRMVCAKNGTILNPYRVTIRDHERRAMIFRYLVYKGLETAFMGMLTRGQIRGTIDSLPGAPTPFESPNLPVELALRQGLELAIEGQAEKSAWFYVAGEPGTLFLRDANGDITHFYLRSTGETRRMPKSSVSEFVEEHMKQQERREDFDRAVQEGRAI